MRTSIICSRGRSRRPLKRSNSLQSPRRRYLPSSTVAPTPLTSPSTSTAPLTLHPQSYSLQNSVTPIEWIADKKMDAAQEARRILGEEISIYSTLIFVICDKCHIYFIFIVFILLSVNKKNIYFYITVHYLQWFCIQNNWTEARRKKTEDSYVEKQQEMGADWKRHQWRCVRDLIDGWFR